MFHVEHVTKNTTNQIFFLSDRIKPIPYNQKLMNLTRMCADWAVSFEEDQRIPLLDRRGGTNSVAPKVQTNGCRGG